MPTPRWAQRRCRRTHAGEGPCGEGYRRPPCALERRHEQRRQRHDRRDGEHGEDAGPFPVDQRPAPRRADGAAGAGDARLGSDHGGEREQPPAATAATKTSPAHLRADTSDLPLTVSVPAPSVALEISLPGRLEAVGWGRFSHYAGSWHPVTDQGRVPSGRWRSLACSRAASWYRDCMGTAEGENRSAGPAEEMLVPAVEVGGEPPHPLPGRRGAGALRGDPAAEAAVEDGREQAKSMDGEAPTG